MAKEARPNQVWRLEVVGVASNTLAGWGLERNRLFDASLQIGQFSAVRPTQKIEDAPICAFGAQVILYDHTGRIRFKGKRVDMEQQGSGVAEHQFYRFVNPYWDLTKRVYHQLWTNYITAGGVSSSTQTYTPHLILNVGRTVAQELDQIISYAASQGVNIDLGTTNAPVTPPPNEVVSRDCASIIQQLLAYAPDSVCYFDYGDGPTSVPVMNCRRAADLEVKNVNIRDAEGLTIRARYEDLATAVAIRYERTDTLTVNGTTREYPVIVTDVYPLTATGREERAVSETVQLSGSSETQIKAQIVCASFPSNFESQAEGVPFWQRFQPILSDPRVDLGSALSPAISTITAGSFLRGVADLGDADDSDPEILDSSLQRYLIAGEIAPWMEEVSGGELQWQKQAVGARFNFNVYDQTAGPAYGTIEKVRDHLLHHKLTATNAPAGTTEFAMQTAFTQGEQPPVGLAQYLYETLSVLGYSGTFSRIQTECDGLINVGHRINILGAAPEWSGMQALVQSVEENLDTGETVISFGVAPGLSLGRILELLRNARTRRRWTSIEQQRDGTVGGSGEVEFGRVTADTDSTQASAVLTYYATKDGTKKISMDASNRTFTMETSSKTGALAALVGDDTASLSLTGGAGRIANLSANTLDAVLALAGGSTGGANRGVSIDTKDAHATGSDGVDKARPLSIVAIRDCESTDPAGQVFNRLIVASARFRVS